MENLSQALEREFETWERLRKYGGTDPFHTDGSNMRLVRNHILHYKRKIEEQCGDGNYPEVYYRETPPEVDWNYMARADEIRTHAQEALASLRNNGDFKYLKSKYDALSEELKKQSSIDAVLGYEMALYKAIADDDLVAMRRYENYGRYADSFRQCAEKIRNYKPPVNSQISIFDSGV